MCSKAKIKNGATMALWVLFAFFVAFPQIVNAASSQWVQRYDGTGKEDDKASAIAVDTKGNVFVTGNSMNAAGNFDYVTIKYNSDGKQQWFQRYDGPGKKDDEASAIAVDTKGNVYVTGSTINKELGRGYATIKYDTNGKQKWVRRYDGPVKGWNEATALAVDTKGNVYVTGSAINKELGRGYATIKYDTNGKQQWVRRYDGPAKVWNEATSIAVDTKGNVYVTGFSCQKEGYNLDYATIKYNGAGAQQWIRRYDGTGKMDDAPTGIAVDTIGNIYVTGYSSSEHNADYITIKYNTNGKQQWVQRYNGPGNNNDWAMAIAMDTKGNVYITGDSVNHLNSTVDFATIKYNSTGKQQWVRRYDGPRNGEDLARAIALDNKGNVYVTGESHGSFGTYEYATIKYNTAGVRQWIQRYRGPGKNDWASAIAVDTIGNAYVTGYSMNTAGNYDYATIKYAP